MGMLNFTSCVLHVHLGYGASQPVDFFWSLFMYTKIAKVYISINLV